MDTEFYIIEGCNKTTIKRINNVRIIPRIEDIVIIEDTEYCVKTIIFDYDLYVISIKVK